MGSDNTYNLDSIREVFIAESGELLDKIESCLLHLEKGSSDDETINILFRAVHTIKGSSGMVNCLDIGAFTHIMENVLDGVRKNEVSIDSELIGLLLESHDFIRELVGLAQSDPIRNLNSKQIERRDAIIGRLNKYMPGEEHKDDVSSMTGSNEIVTESGYHVQSKFWHLSLRFGRDAFRNALDPKPFISYLNKKGRIIDIITVHDDIPHPDEMDPESCYLGFEIVYDTKLDKNGIEDLFEFVKYDCDIRIVPPSGNISEYVKLLLELPETPMLLGEMLVKIGSLTEHELAQAINMQKFLSQNDNRKDADRESLIGEIIIKEGMVQKPVVDAALEKQQNIIQIEEKTRKSFRIDADKLDRIIDLIGELLISNTNVKQQSETIGNKGLMESVNAMSGLVDEIRESTINIRMVEIAETFKRYERIVRDLSKDKSKKIDLIIRGGETELDKTIIEKISDPLMHIIRNAVDHGISTPEENIASGKPERGTITLNAYYKSGSVVIEVIDDGMGLNKEKIFRKAVERGLVKKNQYMSESELFQLIFEPGFSTSDEVTNISGRGVGMDVVKKNIESISGIIDIKSDEGKGTSVRLHLPLTLAIIEGFMIKVGSRKYILPLYMVSECSEFSSKGIHKMESGNFFNLRDELLPFMRLRDFFRINDSNLENETIVVISYANKNIGLVVDEILGEFQTVIKPLSRVFKNIKWISGATILGTGEVVLILDVPMLIGIIEKNQLKVGRSM